MTKRNQQTADTAYRRTGLGVMLALVGLVKPLAGHMALAVLQGLIGHLCASFVTILGAYALLTAAGFLNSFSLSFCLVAVGVVALLRGLLHYGEQWCNHYIAFRLLALIRDRVFTALRRLCPAKLVGRDKGDLIAVITSDIELLEVFYAHTISPALIAVTFGLCMLAFIAAQHLLLGAIALLAYLIVGLLLPLLFSKLSRDRGLVVRRRSGELAAFTLESLRGLPEIMQFRFQAKRQQQMAEQAEELSDQQKALQQVTSANSAITGSVLLFLDLVMLAVALYLQQAGTIGLPGLLLAVLGLMSSFGPFVALANLGSGLQTTFAAGNRVLDILEEEPLVEDISGASPIVFKQATAEQVSFSYPLSGGRKDQSSALILENLSLEVNPGEVLGLIGRSGSGKSTLLRLFMRFWPVSSGAICLSGRSVETINTEDLRAVESYMTQETHLFKDTIHNNVALWRKDISRSAVEEACRKASVHDFIIGLPQGYDTLVAELGDSLSGGERQRLGLARTFLFGGEFLLLDEPTSNLDSLNEAIILKSVREEAKDKAVLLVSHRASTMRIADRTYTIERGRLS